MSMENWAFHGLDRPEPYCIVFPSLQPDPPNEGCGSLAQSVKEDVHDTVVDMSVNVEIHVPVPVESEIHQEIEATTQKDVINATALDDETQSPTGTETHGEAVGAVGIVVRVDSDTATAVEAADATQAAPEDGIDSRQSTECWICRAGGDEPLIRPCACRGSMSGVHLSCVESWIKHHRERTATGDVPCCSVCKQPYKGEETRPGALAFVRHMGTSFLYHALRNMIVLGSVFLYWFATQPENALWLRVLSLALSAPYFAHRTLVLAVSFPVGQQPPAGCWSRFFEANFRVLVVLLAEAGASVFISLIWFMYGNMHYGFLIPVMLFLAVPLVAGGIRARSNSHTCHSVVSFVEHLVRFLVLEAHVFCKNPWRVIDPFDGFVHLLVSAAALILALVCEDRKPLVILFIFHSLILVLSIIEKLVVQWATWKFGPVWWCVLQLAVLSVYVGNLPVLGLDPISLIVLPASLTWLLFCCTLILLVNWDWWVQTYRAWQHRNRQFTWHPQPPAATPDRPVEP